MMEFQITKEYLGFSTHLAYLGPLYEEALQTNMHARNGDADGNATVARIIDGSLEGHALTGMAGVANVGSDRNWTGSHFDQANWYAFGRLAWNPDAGARRIAEEWAAQTFSHDPQAIDKVAGIMMMSREAVVDYMTPLGLHHLMGTGHHYGPAPWVNDLARPDWNPTYYHRADRGGIGFDRTPAGSNAVSRYAPTLARRYADPRATPETLLLWFHHLPWDYAMPSGRTLWQELIAHYDRGVAAVAEMQTRWAALQSYVDAQRHKETAERLARQYREAMWWRDASIAYFQSVSGLALPAGVRPPAEPLEYYQALRFPFAPGNG
jgi:alpha-glucuronidase